MEYLIGIDGGGSKTKIQCFDLSGQVVSETLAGTTDYHQIGADGVISTLKNALGALGVDLRRCLVGFGMPTLGENMEDDEKVVREVKEAFPETLMHLENDVYCAWSGANAFLPGVTVVCGTGSMAVGCDRSGRLARSGGWCEFFSDEGSGYWLGKKALELFSKQSDCRLPKGALHELMREHLNIKDDFQAIDIITSEYATSRKKIAALQMVLFKAQKLGDETAKAAYEQAVKEIAVIVLGVVNQLGFGGDVIDISYIGGLFNENELFFEPFTREINRHFRANVHPPKLSPCHGAALFAINHFEKDRLEEIRQSFLKLSR